VGLYGEARSGRPRTYDEDRVAGLLRTVLQKKPTEGTHWTVRSAASETGLSKSTVARNGVDVLQEVQELLVAMTLSAPC
jgi:putative transposase